MGFGDGSALAILRAQREVERFERDDGSVGGKIGADLLVRSAYSVTAREGGSRPVNREGDHQSVAPVAEAQRLEGPCEND